MSYEYEDGNPDSYTMEDLQEDIEALRRAGLVEVIGITDDGQWLYGATEQSKKIFSSIEEMDSDKFNAIMNDLLSEHNDDTLGE
jgi:hypothetical protein